MRSCVACFLQGSLGASVGPCTCARQQMFGRATARSLPTLRAAAASALRQASKELAQIAREELKDKVQGKIEDIIKENIIKGKLWEDAPVKWVRGARAPSVNVRELADPMFIVDLGRLASAVASGDPFQNENVIEEAVRTAPGAPERPHPFSKTAVMDMGDTPRAIAF